MRGTNKWPTTPWIRKKSSIKEIDLFTLSLRIATIAKRRVENQLHGADASITHFCQTEPTLKAVGLHDDAVSMKVFMYKVFSKMEKMMSFCAIQEGSNDLVGVLIASLFEKSHWFIRKEQGETLRQVMMLKNYATAKARFYETISSEKSVCIDIICVRADHQKNGIGTALLRSCVTRASYFATACVGQFTSGAAQTIARRLQFEVLYELPYYRQHKSRFQVFEACHPEHYSVACMALRLSPPPLQLLLPPKPVLMGATEKPAKKPKEGRKKKK